MMMTKIKELRARRAWSHKQLADIAGVNVRTIQRIEHGDYACFENLKTVPNAFSVDVGELLAPPAAQIADKKGGASHCSELCSSAASAPGASCSTS